MDHDRAQREIHEIHNNRTTSSSRTIHANTTMTHGDLAITNNYTAEYSLLLSANIGAGAGPGGRHQVKDNTIRDNSVQICGKIEDPASFATDMKALIGDLSFDGLQEKKLRDKNSGL